MPWLDLEEDIAEELGGLDTEFRYWAGEGLTLLKSARVGMSRRRCESAPSKYASRVARGLCPCGAKRDSEKLRCYRCRKKRRVERYYVMCHVGPLMAGITYRFTKSGNPAPVRRIREGWGTCTRWQAHMRCRFPGDAVCSRCSSPVYGAFRMCVACREDRRARAMQHRRKRKLCADCSVPVRGSSRCHLHAAKRRVRVTDQSAIKDNP